MNSGCTQDAVRILEKEVRDTAHKKVGKCGWAYLRLNLHHQLILTLHDSGDVSGRTPLPT